MSDYQETEIKLFIPDLKRVETRLQELEAELAVPRVYERNVRYENQAKDLTHQGIVVRLRQDNRVRLTYKGPSQFGGDVRTRFEAEVEVNDFNTMETILEKLGYTPYMVYEKYRTTYLLDGAEVVLDELPYGNFVEIEGDEATINSLLEKLNLQDAPRPVGSYAVLFDFVREHLKLDFTDLTFANFAGIDVPESALEPPEGKEAVKD
jgi:adenylate cyclase, class 2